MSAGEFPSSASVVGRPRPPSVPRVLLLFGALTLRRTINQWRSRWQRSSRGARAGTARKGAPAGFLPLFLALSLVWSSVSQSARVVQNVAVAAERDADPWVVPSAVMRMLEVAELRRPASLDEIPGYARVDLEAAFHRALREQGVGANERRAARVAKLQEHFQQHGRAGFHESQIERVPWPSPGLWYRGASPWDMLRPLALLTLVFVLSIVLYCAVDPGRDLARVDATLEWSFTFPISARGLSLGRVFETALANPLLWFTVLPFFSVVFCCAGFAGWGVALALAASLYVGALAGSLRVVAETVLRRLLPLRHVAHTQTALRLLAGLLFTVALSASWPETLDFLPSWARAAPWWCIYNPFSLPLLPLLGARTALIAGALALASTGILVFAAVLLGERMLRDGLTTSMDPNQGTRRAYATSANRGSGSVRAAVARKELWSLTRDSNRLVQIFVTPLLLVGVQFYAATDGLQSESLDPRHAAALAFAAGALVLTGALLALASEGQALWLLYTTPCTLPRLFLEKAKFWAALGALFTASALVAIAGLGKVTWGAAPYGLLALVGVGLYAWIAVAIGVLGTDVLDPEPRKRMQPSTAYLYMLLAGMFAHALYTPSVWAKFVQLVLSGLLAFAVWQKVRDHAPYLLDPTEAPPARIAAADGILAALAFFVLQALVFWLLQRLRWAPGESLLGAFVGAGLLVTAVVLTNAWRRGLAEWRVALGIDSPPASWLRAGASGLAAGLAGGAFALAYAAMIERFPALQGLRDDALSLGPHTPRPELILLAVGAAPLFEELIFRGVLYTGLRRSLSSGRAIIGSALVFALVHPPIAFVPVLVFALLAATVFEHGKLLIGPIVAHVVYNGFVIAFALS